MYLFEFYDNKCLLFEFDVVPFISCIGFSVFSVPFYSTYFLFHTRAKDEKLFYFDKKKSGGEERKRNIIGNNH